MFGQPYWGRSIVDAVNRHARHMSATFVAQNDYPRVLARPPRERPVVVLRCGYRVGSPTWRGRLFDAFWATLVRRLPDAVRCHYWMGTDAMQSVADVQSGAARLGPLGRTKGDLHIAPSPWLAEELKGIDITATVVKVPWPYKPPTAPPPMPPAFSVLTYLPRERFEFYGGHLVLEAASRAPDVRFVVVGADGAGMPSPPNVEWDGWIPDLAEHYARSSVLVRVPEHDGLGTMVIEALFNARHVIYSYPLPHVHDLRSRTGEALASEIGAMLAAHRAGGLGANLAGRAYAMEHYTEASLVAAIEGAIEGRL